MTKQLLLSISILLTVFSISAQDYFQQKVDYTIDVSLDDKTHFLNGDETFVYHNNSTTSLTFIYIHLWPNAYKNNSTALAKQKIKDNNWRMYSAPESDLGYIDSLDFHIDGQKATWELDAEHIDICKLILNSPLEPGKSIVVKTPFRIKIPSASLSRLGHVEDSYQITQWYPKPAVFDKDGWHQIPYLNQGEFYSEFGSYDVTITLPKNYIVGATGDLQEESEIKFLNEKYDETKKWIAENKEFKKDNRPSNDFPESASETKTITYLQNDVHDFAWFADKRFKVLKGEVELPHSKRKVTTWAMFTPKYAETWRNSLEYLHDATYYYSLWNGDYKYNHVTAVDGTIAAGGGMEYPNITVIGSTNDKFSLETVIMHEVGHNWFYGMLGSNEREHTWMDEGLNSFNESRYMETKYPNKSMLESMMGDKLPVDVKKISYKEMDNLMYLFSARYYADQPMETWADEFSQMNYGMIAYKKSAVVFTYLKAYLGDDLFDECMRDYFTTWSLKHPQPEDLRAIFESKTNKDLSWFFGDIINTTKKVDYKIAGIKKNDSGNYDVKIKNVGQIKSPFSISVISNDSVVNTTWYEPIDLKSKKSFSVNANKGDLIRIDGTHDMPDFFKHNNTVKTKGIFKTIEPIRTKLITGLDGDEYSNLYWLPVLGWNNYNKWMLGVNFHNMTLPSRKFEYSVTPMYSLATNNLNGFARLSWYNEKFDFGLKGQKFNETPNHVDNTSAEKPSTFYQKGNAYFTIKNIAAKNSNLTLSSTYILVTNKFTNDDKDNTEWYDYIVNKIEYTYSKKKLLASHSIKVYAKHFPRLSELSGGTASLPLSLEYNYSHFYGAKKKKIKLRGFVGKQLADNQTLNSRWSTGGSSSVDFEKDYLFLGRDASDGLVSRQVTDEHGGLRMWFGDNQGNNMMFSGLVAFELPFKLPLEVFAGASWSDYQKSSLLLGFPVRNEFNYNLGITLDLQIAKIHFPLLYQQPINGDINIGEAITFEFNIHELNPSKLIRKNIR